MVSLQCSPSQLGMLRAKSHEAQEEMERRFAHAETPDDAMALARASQAAGRTEIQRLMDAVGQTAPVGFEESASFLEFAANLYLAGEVGKATLEERADGTLCLKVEDCPVYRRLESLGAGNTACTCFARRRGWYEAMGDILHDQLETTQKWGDPYCSVTVYAA